MTTYRDYLDAAESLYQQSRDTTEADWQATIDEMRQEACDAVTRCIADMQRRPPLEVTITDIMLLSGLKETKIRKKLIGILGKGTGWGRTRNYADVVRAIGDAMPSEDEARKLLETKKAFRSIPRRPIPLDIF